MKDDAVLVFTLVAWAAGVVVFACIAGVAAAAQAFAM